MTLMAKNTVNLHEMLSKNIDMWVTYFGLKTELEGQNMFFFY